MHETELMTFMDVATEAKLPIRTVYYLNQMGRGPKTVSVGRHLRVRRGDYEAWLTSSGN